MLHLEPLELKKHTIKVYYNAATPISSKPCKQISQKKDQSFTKFCRCLIRVLKESQPKL